jgi:hypothetical protein
MSALLRPRAALTVRESFCVDGFVAISASKRAVDHAAKAGRDQHKMTPMARPETYFNDPEAILSAPQKKSLPYCRATIGEGRTFLPSLANDVLPNDNVAKVEPDP